MVTSTQHTRAGRVAVVGSGIAGLAASWYLGKTHAVTLFEKQPDIGMAAHGIEWGGARVDMPLRVLYRGYYPTLSALYDEADIATTSADYSASFSDLGGDAYFRYRNWRPLQRWSVPMLAGGQPWGARSRAIVRDLIRLYRRAACDARKLKNSETTLQAYLDEGGYSAGFADDFLLPTFAAIGTCSIDAVRRYPALVIIDYLRRGVLLEGVSRTVRGADFVVRQLSRRCQRVLTGTGIAELRRDNDGVVIIDEHGEQHRFDHVVLATQGNQALRLLQDASADEAQALARFSYEPSEVIVHTDTRLMPRRRADWSPVNFFTETGASRPMASIWLNRVLPVAKGTADAFQTWNPLMQPDPESVLARARFERPCVDHNSEQGLIELDTLHGERGRRVWFCGSYAAAGVPLLESAARSALGISRRIHQA